MRRCAGLLALLALASSGCAKKPPSFPRAPLVLISVDTLRADHLPAYGYAKVETPAIDALRKDGVLFTNAFTHAPLTLPAHASVFTGLLPAEHGIRDNLGYTLAPGAATLATVLKGAGYATGGAVSAIVLSRRSGISRGFDVWDDAIESADPNVALARVQRPGDETAELLTRFVDGARGKPFFAFLHVYEPHAPYEPPEPFRSRFALPYDGEIAAADAVVGRFLDGLKEKGLYDGALIVLFSDHGEGLGEHGEDEHGLFLYRETLHVPLVMKLPGGARHGATSGALAALSDIFPTTLGALGVAAPAHQATAVSLLPFFDAPPAAGARRVFSETFFPRIHFGWSGLASLTDGRFHYIEAPRPELYDLRSDRNETRNLVAEKPDALRALKVDMEKRDRAFVKPGMVDPEEKKKLAALGYVSAGAPSPEGALRDPKDGVETLRRVKDAFAAMGAGHDADAARDFEALLKEQPRLLDVWEAYSQVLFRLGRGKESLAALERTIPLAPEGSTHFLASVAELSLMLGQVDEAVRHASIAADRGDPDAFGTLARAALAERDLPRAETFAMKARDAAPGKRQPLVVLARVEAVRGNFSRALEYLDSARTLGEEKKLGAMRSLQRLRGDMLGALGRPGDAEAAYRDEIRLFGDEIDARASLAILYGASGRMADARRVLDEMTGVSPTPAGYDSAARVLSILGDRAGAEEFRRRAASKGAVARQGP